LAGGELEQIQFKQNFGHAVNDNRGLEAT